MVIPKQWISRVLVICACIISFSLGYGHDCWDKERALDAAAAWVATCQANVDHWQDIIEADLDDLIRLDGLVDSANQACDVIASNINSLPEDTPDEVIMAWYALYQTALANVVYWQNERAFWAKGYVNDLKALDTANRYLAAAQADFADALENWYNCVYGPAD